MDAHRVSEREAEADLRALIDRAASGESVVITRDGEAVAELRPAPTTLAVPKRRTPEAIAALQRLDELRESIGPLGITSVELLNGMYEETPW